MNTTEIHSCLAQDSRVGPEFLGVFPCDKLPIINALPSAIVANTDRSRQPGQHWIAMYFPVDSEPLYFDSYGLPPQQRVFKEYLGHHKHNNNQLQSPFSSTCGQYSVFFLAMVCRGISMKQIQETFDPKCLEENDVEVTKFVNSNYDLNTSVCDFDFLTKQICTAMKDVKINGKHVCPIHM